MSKDSNKSMPIKPSRFSIGNILLTLGIVIVSILIALTLQAWYTTFLVQNIVDEQILPVLLETEAGKNTVSVSLEEKYAVLNEIDATNPTSTITTEDKKQVLQAFDEQAH